jgi:hypothetical protein
VVADSQIDLPEYPMTVVIEGAEVVLAIRIVGSELVEGPNALEDGSLVIDRQVGEATGK